MNTILPQAHRWPSAKVSPDHGIKGRETCSGLAFACGVGTKCFTHGDEGCVCSGRVSVSGAWGLGAAKRRRPHSPGPCMFPSASRRLQQIRVGFNHFTVAERSRHFQGLTHLTCFRNVPEDEAKCLPEGPFPLLRLWRQFGWSGQMQIPALVTGDTHPAPVWPTATAILETKPW